MNKTDMFNELDILIKKESNQDINALLNELLKFTHHVIHDNGLREPSIQEKIKDLFQDFNNPLREKKLFQLTTKTHLFIELFKDIR